MFEKFKKVFSRAEKKGVGQLKDDSKIWKSLRNALRDSNTVQDAYKNSLWTYSAVSAISANLTRAPFKIYKNVKEDYAPLQRDETTEGPIYDLLQSPNPLMTNKALMVSTITFLELYGEAFWILDGRANATEVPKAIWSFSPERFEPIVDKKLGQLTGWMYKKGDNEEVPLALHEVLFFRYFNPYDDIRGMSPLEAAQLSVDQDFYASVYNKEYFKNGAGVGGSIEVEEELSEPVFNRILSQFEDRHQGASNAHKIALLEGGAKFKEFKVSQKDLDFASLKKITMLEILAAYKVNPVVLGDFEHIKSHEGVNAAHKAFWTECIIPKIAMLEEVINIKFLGKLKGKFKGEFDLNSVEALREDFYRKSDAAAILQQMGYPINMINKRLRLGMNDVDWGDEWWIEASKLPAGEEPPSEEGKDDVKVAPPATDDEGGKQYDLLILAQQGALERKFLSKFKRFLFEQRKIVVETLHNSIQKGNVDLPAVMKKTLSEKSSPMLEKLLKETYIYAVQVGAESLAADLGDENFVFNVKDFEEAINERSSTILDEIYIFIEGKILDLTEDDLKSGDTVYDILEKAKKIYNKIDKKTKHIAKMEATGSFNLGRVTLMKKLGFKAHKWVYLGDTIHKSIDNKLVLLNGGSFISGSSIHYPCDLSSTSEGCTCITVPMINKQKIKEESKNG